MNQFLEVAQNRKTAYPDASLGILVIEGVRNPEQHAGLEERKSVLLQELKSRFAGAERSDLMQLPSLQAYRNYYKRFKKSYHVQLQLESVIFKDKPLPRVAALVEAMFMAELETQLLTAGHDLDSVDLPLVLDAASGEEQFVQLSGAEQTLKPGDMYIRDSRGIISSIIYGPDQRTQIRPETKRVLFTTYGPPGLDNEAILQHMKEIQANVSFFSPEAQVDRMQVITAA